MGKNIAPQEFGVPFTCCECKEEHEVVHQECSEKATKRGRQVCQNCTDTKKTVKENPKKTLIQEEANQEKKSRIPSNPNDENAVKNTTSNADPKNKESNELESEEDEITEDIVTNDILGLLQNDDDIPSTTPTTSKKKGKKRKTKSLFTHDKNKKREKRGKLLKYHDHPLKQSRNEKLGEWACDICTEMFDDGDPRQEYPFKATDKRFSCALNKNPPCDFDVCENCFNLHDDFKNIVDDVEEADETNEDDESKKNNDTKFGGKETGEESGGNKLNNEPGGEKTNTKGGNKTEEESGGNKLGNGLDGGDNTQSFGAKETGEESCGNNLGDELGGGEDTNPKGGNKTGDESGGDRLGNELGSGDNIHMKGGIKPGNESGRNEKGEDTGGNKAGNELIGREDTRPMGGNDKGDESGGKKLDDVPGEGGKDTEEELQEKPVEPKKQISNLKKWEDPFGRDKFFYVFEDGSVGQGIDPISIFPDLFEEELEKAKENPSLEGERPTDNLSEWLGRMAKEPFYEVAKTTFLQRVMPYIEELSTIQSESSTLTGQAKDEVDSMEDFARKHLKDKPKPGEKTIRSRVTFCVW